VVERDGNLFWETREGDLVPAGGLSWTDMERDSEFSKVMRDDDDYVLYIVRAFLRALGEFGNVTLVGNGVKMRGLTNKKKYSVSIALGKTKSQLKASAGEAYIADFLKGEQYRVYDVVAWSMRRKVDKAWEILPGFVVKPFALWRQPTRPTNQPPKGPSYSR